MEWWDFIAKTTAKQELAGSKSAYIFNNSSIGFLEASGVFPIPTLFFEPTRPALLIPHEGKIVGFV